MGTKNNPGQFDCYAKLEPDEPHFVLRGRDPLAGTLVRAWADGAEQRLNAVIAGSWITRRPEIERQQAKIAEARRCANEMDAYCRDHGKLPARWTTKAPVITQAPAKTTVTREQIERVLFALSEGETSSAMSLVTELARAAGVPE